MFGKKNKGANHPPVLESSAEENEDKKAKDGTGEAEDGSAKIEPPKKSKKKIFIILGAILLLCGIGAGVYFSGILGKPKEKVTVEVGPDGKPIEKAIYYNLPEFLVNLNSQGKAASFLKATVILEVAHPSDVPQIEANLPRVVDAFNTYLRELRTSDLVGSAGIQRLREELLLRVNKAVSPIKVNDVLFKEIVVQ